MQQTELFSETEQQQAVPVHLQVGTLVKVNCWRATVTRVITSFEHRDPFRGSESPLPLLHPLYELELDFERKFSWNEKRVHVPSNCKRLKLFADEFEVLPWCLQPTEALAATPSPALPPA